MPRYGMADIVNGKTRMRSGHKRQNASGHFHTVAHYKFLPENPKWLANKYHLTYAFLAGTLVDAMNPVAKAFTTWAGNTHFTFSVTQGIGNVDLTIGFHHGYHGDGSPFDGHGGVWLMLLPQTIGGSITIRPRHGLWVRWKVQST
ncbi:hypothetical protein Patl1_22001 [Pistacia atlantica]|uniref:Uncharacterized protein n=1 Tax=Pistacia atlantica TaxID=434234 RepID=A0ACC1BLN8_9ROSI|nr:hypothetical protein Patl1_22001 [Pistacia atlantica]